eukprot:2940743-Pleurochrysis_carterae.AAC.1
MTRRKRQRVAPAPPASCRTLCGPCRLLPVAALRLGRNSDRNDASGGSNELSVRRSAAAGLRRCGDSDDDPNR